MKPVLLSCIALGGACLITISGVRAEANQQKDQGKLPNFIIVMADDLGYGDIGCFGNQHVNTPALDRMAREGMKFTAYYSNGAVCSPTRAALMTGNYQQRAGIEGVIYAALDKRGAGGLRSEETTLPEIFRTHGYATGIFGKWHLGYQMEHNPVNHGFDEFYGYVSGNVDFISHRDGVNIYDWWHNTDTICEEGYVTDLITNRALTFMEKNRENPFLLYLPPEAPHYPYQGRNDKADRLPGKAFKANGSRPDPEVAYKEMIEVMDENIARIFSKMEALGLSSNAFVIFCSDNGAVALGSNGNLSGYNASLWEGGIRVPAIFWYLQRIAPGTSTNEPVLSIDILPTGSDEYLFDLDADPGEKTDLSVEKPGKVRRYKKLVKAWETEMGRYKLQTL